MEHRLFRAHRSCHIGVDAEKTESLLMVLLRAESQQGADILFKMDGGRAHPRFLQGGCHLGQLIIPRLQHHQLKAVRLRKVLILYYHMIIISIGPADHRAGRA